MDVTLQSLKLTAVLLLLLGAGKTTTFKILTGDLSATSGTAAVAGYDVKTNLRGVRMADYINIAAVMFSYYWMIAGTTEDWLLSSV